MNKNIGNTILRKSNKDCGASLVEYALLVALVAVVCIAAMQTFGAEVAKKNYYNMCIINQPRQPQLEEDCRLAAIACHNGTSPTACNFVKGLE